MWAFSFAATRPFHIRAGIPQAGGMSAGVGGGLGWEWRRGTGIGVAAGDWDGSGGAGGDGWNEPGTSRAERAEPAENDWFRLVPVGSNQCLFSPVGEAESGERRVKSDVPGNRESQIKTRKSYPGQQRAGLFTLRSPLIPLPSSLFPLPSSLPLPGAAGRIDGHG
jgi:hypothetical protein